MVNKRSSCAYAGNERGDTLIEVTIALVILSVVIMGATSLAMRAYRQGQTGGERTEISNMAQQQMEALRSFRDNHIWSEFRSGSSPAYKGVDTAMGTACRFNPAKSCFHMELASTGAATEWVPAPGPITGPVPGVPTLGVPTGVVEIWADDSGAATRNCNYDFEVHYSFQTQGGGVDQASHIRTRLSNLKYDPLAFGAGACL